MKMTEEVKTERREARKLANKRANQLAIITAEQTQKPVKHMTINIEWKKSRTWGWNPTATARIAHHDGTYSNIGPFTTSGCGYDKESTVVSDIFNAALKYKLYKRFRGEKPYGVYYYNGKFVDEGSYLKRPDFNGGVGMECYPHISHFIGGQLKHTANGKTFDCWEYIDKRSRGKK